MRRKDFNNIVFTGMAGILALVFILTALMPYGILKQLANSLMSDGNFDSLKEQNAPIFKILLGITGLLFLSAAIGIRTRRLQSVLGLLRKYVSDLTEFIHALRPTKVDAFSLAALILIIGLAVISRLVHINDGMNHDEAYTFVVFSSTSLFNIVTNYHLPNNHILNSLLIFFSTHLFGIQPWAVRLPALIAGVLLIPASYALAKAIYDKNTALLSALLIAILPGAILYSTIGRGYSLVALFTILTLWLANYLRQYKNLFAWSLLILFFALGFYSIPVMLFPFGMVFIWLFFENLIASPGVYGSKINFLKYWLFAGVGTIMLVLILYTPIFIYTGVEKVFANQFVLPESWLGYIPSIPGRLLTIWHTWINGLSSIWIYLLIAGFVLSLVFHGRIARQRFPLQIAALIWVTALILIYRPVIGWKIWVFLQAPFMIWSAAGIMGLLKDFHLKVARNVSVGAIGIGIALLLTVVNIIPIVPTIPDRWAEKGPVELTVLSIKDRLTPQDLIIIDLPYDAALWYYSHLYGLADSRFNKLRPFDELFVIVSRSDEQTVQSVIQARGPDPALVNLEAARFLFNYQNLDVYIVPHR